MKNDEWRNAVDLNLIILPRQFGSCVSVFFRIYTVNNQLPIVISFRGRCGPHPQLKHKNR
jgi:hypothetical protein